MTDMHITGRMIEEFPRYRVTHSGEVLSTYGGKIRVLKQNINESGYHRVGLSHNNRKKNFCVHVLVARLWLPKPPSYKTQVNHIDGNKSNNDKSNLEWVSPSQNILHSWSSLPRKKKKGRVGVVGIDGTIYRSMRQASKAIGISVPAIRFDLHSNRNNHVYFLEDALRMGLI